MGVSSSALHLGERRWDYEEVADAIYAFNALGLDFGGDAMTVEALRYCCALESGRPRKFPGPTCKK